MLSPCTTLSYGLRRSTIFSHIFSQKARFSKKSLLNTKRVFRYFAQLLSEKFLILRRNERDVIKKKVYWSSCNLYSCPVLMKLEISRQIFEKPLSITFNEYPSMKNKINENFKTAIQIKNYDRPKRTRECGIF